MTVDSTDDGLGFSCLGLRVVGLGLSREVRSKIMSGLAPIRALNTQP